MEPCKDCEGMGTNTRDDGEEIECSACSGTGKAALEGEGDEREYEGEGV